jgi:phosphodiesterase/alkaline phosphatase D-like protein
MNRNSIAIVGLLGLLLGGAAVYLAVRNPSPANNSVIINGNDTSNVGDTQNPGVPVVATKAAGAVSQSTAVLNADVNPNGAQTSYYYEYGALNALNSKTSTQLIGGGYINYSAPATVTGLNANTTYYFRIVAENEKGKTPGAVLSFTTSNTPPAPFIPATATTEAATNITTNNATINGTTNPHGATTFFWFEYGESPSLGKTTPTGSVGASKSNITVSANLSVLDPNKTYYFRLNTQNGYGVTNGSILNFSTKELNPPPTSTPPLILPTANTSAASSIQRTTATLKGQIDPSGIQTNYYFEYGKTSSSGIVTLDQKTPIAGAGSGTQLSSVSANISSLTPGTLYHYRLVGENKNGATHGAIRSFTTKN